MYSTRIVPRTKKGCVAKNSEFNCFKNLGQKYIVPALNLPAVNL